MNPMTLALLLGGGSALQELTTGQEQRKKDSELKAANYRASPYTSAANPDAVSVHQPNALGAGLQGFGSGYQLGQNAETAAALRNFFNTKSGLPPGGIDPSVNQAESTRLNLDPVPEPTLNENELSPGDPRAFDRVAANGPYSQAHRQTYGASRFSV